MNRAKAIALIDNERWFKDQYLNLNKSIKCIAEELELTWFMVNSRKTKFKIKSRNPRDEILNKMPVDVLNKLKSKNWLSFQFLDLNKTINIIAKELPAAPGLVKSFLTEYNITIPQGPKKSITKDTRIKLENKNWLKKEYITNLRSRYDIAKELKTTIEVVGAALKNYSIPIRSNQEAALTHISKESLSKLNKPKWLYKQYVTKDRTTIDIANELDVSNSTITNYLIRYKIQLRNFISEETLNILDNKKLLSNMYIKQPNVNKLANELKIKSSQLASYLKFHQISTKQNQLKHISKENADCLHSKEWLELQYISNERSSVSIAKELGVTPRCVGLYLHYFGIKIATDRWLRRSQAERDITDFLKQNSDLEILTSDRKLIHPLELDIIIPEKKICIEFCGVYWHSTAHDKFWYNTKYHLQKLELCEQQGYRLITIFEDEWEQKQPIVKSKLLHILGCNSGRKIPGRKTTIKEISLAEKKEFLSEYHIQGTGPGSVNLGLFFEDELVSVLVLKNMKQSTWDLNRFASSCNVQGGFSKLLSYFKKNYKWKEIYTFADRRWSSLNSMYSKSGFEFEYITSPNHFYVIGDTRESRQKYQKHKLPKILGSEFNPELTALENTDAAGIHRIYDCGNIKYVIRNHRGII